MRQLTELIVQTTPSTLRHPGMYRRTQEPYRRILSVESTLGSVVALNTVCDSDKTIEKLRVPPLFARRLLLFMKKYVAAYDPESADAQMEDNETYNCHRFALDMVGVPTTDRYQAGALAKSLAVICAPRSTPLPLGTYAVVRNKDPRQKRARLAHSFIGLGKDNPDCLQVVFTGGHIGLAPYEQVLADYARFESVEIAALPSSRIMRVVRGIAGGVGFRACAESARIERLFNSRCSG